MDRIDYEIAAFSDDWFGLPFSCKHLLRHFLPDVRLVWVQTIGLRSPEMSLYDLRRTAAKLLRWASPARVTRGSSLANLNIIDPIQIPYGHLGAVRAINQAIMIRTLHSRVPLPAGRRRVFFTTWPFLPRLVGKIGDSLSVYYRVDDFAEFPGVKRDYIQRVERELIQKVDIVVATAEKLIPAGQPPQKARYLPHGVDFEHFSKPGWSLGLQSPLSRITRPRIGFFGLLSSWIDLDLISSLAARRPNWQFVLIGPSQLPVASQPRGPNIHYLGPMTYEELPVHAGEFDVGLIPFKINALTQAVNPLKLLEYFSIGFPVVSSPLPEVMKYADHLLVAEGAGGFEAAIATALATDNPQQRMARRRIAEENSWARRAGTLRGWIEEALALE